MQPVLSIRRLAKSFGETRAVTDLSLEIQSGEIVGLIGPDGAGKTTTMRMVAGLISATHGEIEVLGRRVGGDLPAIRSLLGYMPQQFSLYGDLSVEENLRFFAGMYGVRRHELVTREKRLLQIARLEEFRDRMAQALSGGMYKKLALSCALVHEPHLLLLDEPTNGVDPISRRELWDLLKERVRDGLGVLISTPYMDEAERCDRVGVLVDGRLKALATPAELKAGFTAKILELATAVPLGGAALFLNAPAVEQAYTVGRKIHLVTRDATAARAALAEILGRVHATIVSLNEVAPSFEDIFLSLAAEPGAAGESHD
jgi:ABC-2 type transport system ATP-binding protein